MTNEISVRTIEPQDNKELAKIVRDTLAEFGSDKPGTVYYDPTTDKLFELFQKERSCYFVAFRDDKMLGGAGIYPTENLPPDVCELVKVYLLPESRGIGLGKQLILQCLEAANGFGYKQVYLETMPEMKIAIPLYERLGFQYLENSMGNSGHFGCDVWMIKSL
ncbi:MAG: GNAT family N-acetyltransferase [Pyrinomonadaceae bacterium]|nr:GNAT family N-acetyltransferase [Pyrinomonadaceae bacterium]